MYCVGARIVVVINRIECSNVGITRPLPLSFTGQFRQTTELYSSSENLLIIYILAVVCLLSTRIYFTPPPFAVRTFL